jgi:hypothetical protein
MRYCVMDDLDREIVTTIHRARSKVNSFVEMFLRVGEFMRIEEVLIVQLASHEAPGVDLRKHNRPLCKEVASILLDDNTRAKRDSFFAPARWGITAKCDRHHAYDPLQFPLLFPRGEPLWH